MLKLDTTPGTENLGTGKFGSIPICSTIDLLSNVLSEKHSHIRVPSLRILKIVESQKYKTKTQSTRLITWITPLDAARSASVTSALEILTPPYKRYKNVISFSKID